MQIETEFGPVDVAEPRRGFTPTTEQVRNAYVRAMRNAFVASSAEHEAEFDRWLAAHDRDGEDNPSRHEYEWAPHLLCYHCGEGVDHPVHEV